MPGVNTLMDTTMAAFAKRRPGLGKLRAMALTGIALAFGLVLSGAAYADAAHAEMRATPQSHGVYRLPFADGTNVKVFWDFLTHRPPGRIDLFAVGGPKPPYRAVAAAAGRIVAIQDGFTKRQKGGPGVVCHQNYVWIAHPNGEWTTYDHLAHDSVTKKAGLKVGDEVRAGQYLGDEGEVRCAMLKHVHFEVVTPDLKDPIDSGGFLKDNDDAKRERNPRFCGVPGWNAIEGKVYVAVACNEKSLALSAGGVIAH